MKVTGITAEYNPLHNGHVYHICETRSRTGCDALVVAMSGDYVQRGEAAILDKWSRTEAALRSGADLVIEIPVLFCLGNASQYASASVRLLEELGCDYISFGSESGDAELLDEVSAVIKKDRQYIEDGISEMVSEGLSYPAARARVYRYLRAEKYGIEEKQLEKETGILSDPNDILALEYIMNMRRAEPAVIMRQGAGYSDILSEDALYQSAGAIRRQLSRKHNDTLYSVSSELSAWMPKASCAALDRSVLTFPDDWAEILRYAVMSSEASTIDDCPSGGEGLGNLLKKAVRREDSWDAIIKSVKSRRYTYTRISRLCMQIILGITRSRYPLSEPEYIRVLGFTAKGRRLLSECKHSKGCSLPLITNINREADQLSAAGASMLELDIHASDIYDLVTGRDCISYSDHVKKPVIIS